MMTRWSSRNIRLRAVSILTLASIALLTFAMVSTSALAADRMVLAEDFTNSG